MGLPAELAITAHDYMGMPQGPPYFQLIEGDLFMSPSPHWRHQTIILNIAGILNPFVRKKKLGRVLVSPMDVCLTEINVYQPDVLFFSRSGKAKLGERCVEGAPDFVVEILSESTAHLDQGPKKKIYARCGVKELWFVEPILKEIEIFDLQVSLEKPRAVYGIRDKFQTPLFPGLIFSAGKIFQDT